MSAVSRSAILGAALGAAVLTVQPGSAVASTLLDFTSTARILEAGSGSFLGTNYTITTTGGALTTNVPFDGGACPAPLACDGDGFGVGDDEITDPGTVAGGESLTVTFDSAVNLAALYFLDLFIDSAIEQVTYSINGGAGVTANAIAAGDAFGGFLQVVLGGVSVTSITFTAADLFGDDGTNDYALAAIQAVPVPPAFILLLTALGGLGFLGWRRRRSLA